MTSSLGGSDAAHDLPPDIKDREERRLREEARKTFADGDKKGRDRKLSRANEISRKKSKKAHKRAD